MTAKSTKSKTNRKKTGTTSKKSTSNKKTTKKNTKKTTRSTRTAKSGNSFLMDEILIWITLAVSIILLISNFGVAGFLGDAVSGVLWEIFGAVAYIIPFVLFGLVSFQVSNKGNRYAYMKTVIAVLLLFLAEILLQLVDELGKDRKGTGICINAGNRCSRNICCHSDPYDHLSGDHYRKVCIKRCEGRQ